MDICFSGKFARHDKNTAGTKAVNAGLRVVEEVRTTTHYLVAADLSSSKARKAGRFGTVVLTESEFEDYLEFGFPVIEAPGKPPRSTELPIAWTKLESPFNETIEYADAYGVITQIAGRVFEQGSLKRDSGRTRYWRVQLSDRERVLALREDRILSPDFSTRIG
jgi:hypothetical protein